MTCSTQGLNAMHGLVVMHDKCQSASTISDDMGGFSFQGNLRSWLCDARDGAQSFCNGWASHCMHACSPYLLLHFILCCPCLASGQKGGAAFAWRPDSLATTRSVGPKFFELASLTGLLRRAGLQLPALGCALLKSRVPASAAASLGVPAFAAPKLSFWHRHTLTHSKYSVGSQRLGPWIKVDIPTRTLVRRC